MTSTRHSKTENAQMALEVQELRIGYKHARTPLFLGGVLDFAIPEGRVAAVLGVNGIGKSTLLRTLAGIQPALSGSIRISGKPAGELKAGMRARLQSVVLTDPPASRNLLVSELVALGRHPHTNWLGQLTGPDLEAVSYAMDRMEVANLADQPCHTLSDGQLQRVQIARALAQDTPLMLLDEPTSHLDLYHKVRILNNLKDIAHSLGKAVLFTTHEINMAIELCDYLLLLKEDRSGFGKPGDLIESGAFTALFPGDTVRFDKESQSFRIK